MELYELICKLIGRGCPDCPWFEWSDDREVFCFEGEACPDEMVRAGWAMWALNWMSELRGGPLDLYKPAVEMIWYEHDEQLWMRLNKVKLDQDAENTAWQGSMFSPGPEHNGFEWQLLRAIEAATRHLKPKTPVK